MLRNGVNQYRMRIEERESYIRGQVLGVKALIGSYNSPAEKASLTGSATCMATSVHNLTLARVYIRLNMYNLLD